MSTLNRVRKLARKAKVEDPRRVVDASLGLPIANDFQRAVMQAQWTEAGRLFSGLTDWNDRNLLISTVADTPGRPDALERWIWEQPHNPLALLVRGAHSVRWAWQVREDSDAAVDAAVFYERLRLAEDDLSAVSQMAPDNPLSWSWLLRSGRGLRIPSEELGMRFGQCSRREPELWHAHHQLLMGLSARAGGNDAAMLQFARLASSNARDGAAIHDLIPVVHLELWRSAGKPPTASYFFAEVAEEILDAARRSVFHPSFASVNAYAPAIRSLNAFALTCSLASANDQAAKLLQTIGNRVTNFPWNFDGQPPIESHASVVASVNARLLHIT